VSSTSVPAAARQRAAALRAEIEHHNYLSYIQDTPAISDAQFDSSSRAAGAREPLSILRGGFSTQRVAPR
jgi:DNA ligase (NAD+)